MCDRDRSACLVGQDRIRVEMLDTCRARLRIALRHRGAGYVWLEWSGVGLAQEGLRRGDFIPFLFLFLISSFVWY